MVKQIPYAFAFSPLTLGHVPSCCTIIPQELEIRLSITIIGARHTVLLQARRQTLEEVNLLEDVSPKVTDVDMQGLNNNK